MCLVRFGFIVTSTMMVNVEVHMAGAVVFVLVGVDIVL
jgi:hypothetical protein